MRIAIYDIRHYEMVHVLFRLFDTPENEILFLISPLLKEKLISVSGQQMSRHTIITENPEESHESFLLKCKKEIEKFKPAFLHCNTIDKDYKYMSRFLKNCSIPYSITIHNINTWLAPPFTLNRTALQNYYHRKKMVKGSSMLVVQEELFVSYIQNKNLYKKPVITIPHTLQEEKPVENKNEKIVVSIPGAIDGVRRDIGMALDVMEAIHQKSKQFQFVFAGKVLGHLGEKIWQRVEQLQQKGLDIQHCYDEKSNVVFDEQMKKCDVVFLPLNVKTKYEGIDEIYGTTKVTGVMYDMMRAGKPGIVPAEMVIPPTMNGSIISYQNKKDLTEKLLALEAQPAELKKRKQAALRESEYYREEAIRQRVIPQIKKYMSAK